MSNGEITTEIERFIFENINSVEQLEVLLLLASAPQQNWSANEVSQKLYRQPNSVANRLEDLQKRGLLSVDKSSSELMYRYAGSGSQDVVLRGLERAYRVRQDAVIALIFNRPSAGGPSDNKSTENKPSDDLRAFSDAFRFRRPN